MRSLFWRGFLIRCPIAVVVVLCVVCIFGSCASASADQRQPESDPSGDGMHRIWGHDSLGTTTPTKTWYLAEGCTYGGVETWVLVQNPNDSAAGVQLTYMTTSGPVAGPCASLPPYSRKSFNVGDTVVGQLEVSTKVSADKPVVAERSMYGPKRSWGTNSIGASETSKTWYLAEGCTNGGFESWILVQNPNNSDADIQLTYMTPEGEKPGPSATLPPNSRNSFNVADVVPNNWDVSTVVTAKLPVVAERAVYWNGRKGAHDSVGVTAPHDTWYLAEGCTGGSFETWVLVQNPGDSPASVGLTFMTETGEKPGPRLDLAPHTRRSVNVSTVVPNDWSVSTKVESTQPVIAERAVYWNGRIEGHDSIGATEPSATWYLAEGCTGTGFETWVLVQNPNSVPASVQLTYMTPAGLVGGPFETIPANSRKTFNVADTVPGVYEVATRVTSSVPVIAERAMYGGPEEVDLGSTFASILSRYTGMTAGIGFVEMDSGSVVNSGYQQPFTGASTTKVLTACYLLQQVEQGNVSLDAYVGGHSVRWHLQQMIQQSNNDSWHTLKNMLGWDNLEQYAHQIGIASFSVYANTITASDMALLLRKMYSRQLLSQNDTGLLLSFMQNTNNETLIPAALPAGAVVYHKYGNLNNNLHDAAVIIYNGRTYVLAIYTRSNGPADYTQSTALIHRITQAVIDSYP